MCKAEPTASQAETVRITGLGLAPLLGCHHQASADQIAAYPSLPMNAVREGGLRKRASFSNFSQV